MFSNVNKFAHEQSTSIETDPLKYVVGKVRSRLAGTSHPLLTYTYIPAPFDSQHSVSICPLVDTNTANATAFVSGPQVKETLVAKATVIADAELAAGTGDKALALWETATAYTKDQIIVDGTNSKIYQIAVTHTSGTLATDIANGYLVELLYDYYQKVVHATPGNGKEVLVSILLTGHRNATK